MCVCSPGALKDYNSQSGGGTSSGARAAHRNSSWCSRRVTFVTAEPAGEETAERNISEISQHFEESGATRDAGQPGFGGGRCFLNLAADFCVVSPPEEEGGVFVKVEPEEEFSRRRMSD